MRLKHAICISLALLGWAATALATDRGASAEVPLFAEPVSLNVSLQNGQMANVTLTPSQETWHLDVSQAQHSWLNTHAIPQHHVLDTRAASQPELKQTADGFSLHIRYPAQTLVEHYTLKFRLTPDEKCPRLVQFRRAQYEVIQGRDALRSGIEADYARGLARLLAISGEPSNVVRAPIALMDPALCLDELSSIVIFTPQLAVPLVH